MVITPYEIQVNTVRALSWKQPYAQLMLYGKQETRTWSTEYRGLVLICSSLQAYSPTNVLNLSGQEQYDRIIETLEKPSNGYSGAEDEFLPGGKALAIGRLVNCVPMGYSKDENEITADQAEAETFVKYNARLWVHYYDFVTPIKIFNWKGSQGWRTLTPEQKEQIILL